MTCYDIFVNCNSFDTVEVVHFEFTQIQYTEQHNKTKYTEHDTPKNKNILT